MTIITHVFELLFALVEEGLRLLVDVIERHVGAGQAKSGYHAKFIGERELLSTKHTGFCLTGKRNISNKQSYTNALIAGAPGTGKTACVLLPGAFTMTGSLIFNDPSSEVYKFSSGYLASDGRDIKVLNFTKPDISCGYNPLHLTNTSSEIQKVATMLIENGQPDTKDKFWILMATGLTANFISLVKKMPPEFQTMHNVLHLLNNIGHKDDTAVDALFNRYADDRLFDEFCSFKKYDQKLQTSVIATAKASLQIFQDENVAKVTSYNTIDMSDFRNKRCALYIQNSIADARYYSVLTSIFMEQLFTYLLSRFPEPSEQDVYLMLDEASSLKIPTLPLAVANLRKHRAGCCLIVQDHRQLFRNYGKDDGEVIRANCFAKVFFSGASLEVTKELESILGKTEVTDEDGKKKVLPLMSADDIRTMSLDQSIILCGHHRPILAKMYPYYENPKYRKYAAMPTPELHSTIPFTTIPTLILENDDDDDE